MNILIIEDEPVNAKLAHVILSFEGYSVCDVKSAEQAIAAIRQSKPHLIVLDFVLPGMDGLSFARQLKQDPETQNIKIIAVTAYSNRFSHRQALEAGCEYYFIKPFDTRLLCAHVAELAQNLG